MIKLNKKKKLSTRELFKLKMKNQSEKVVQEKAVEKSVTQIKPAVQEKVVEKPIEKKSNHFQLHKSESKKSKVELSADDLLRYIPKYHADINDDWMAIAMAHKNAGGTRTAFVNWSMTSTYKDKVQAENGWNNLIGSYTIGTLYYYATSLPSNSIAVTPIKPIFKKIEPEIEKIDIEKLIKDIEPLEKLNLSPTEQLIQQIKSIYNPDEHILIGENVIVFSEQKHYINPQKEWIENLEKNGNKYHGQYMKINPYTGTIGKTKENKDSYIADDCISDYRNILLEFDDINIEKQLRLARLLIDAELPVRTVTFSGSKSVHIIMQVNAKNSIEWDEKVKKILFKKYLIPLGADQNCSNSSRGTRTAGIIRPNTGKEQTLYYANNGKLSTETTDEIINKFAMAVGSIITTKTTTALATPIRFWSTNPKTKKSKIIVIKLIDFLAQKGFAKIKIDNDFKFVKIDKMLVEMKDKIEIKDYITSWLRKNQPQLLAFFAAAPNVYIGQDKLELLPTITIDFQHDTKNEVYFYYQNGFLKITKNNSELLDYSELPSYIWADAILKRNYNPTIEKSEFEKFFSHINNGDPERITALQSAFGYLLSRYKNKAIAKAIILNDEELDNEAGGTGKSLFFDAISNIRKMQKIDCKNRIQNQFIFQSIHSTTEVLHFEDPQENYNFSKLFNAVTGNFDVEGKGVNIFTIPFETSAKIGLSTNYVIKGSSTSHRRRIVEYEFFNYYNDTFTPEEEFGHLFFDDWTEKEFNKFDNFCIKSVQLFLEKSIIKPNIINLEKRKLINEIGKDFVEFLDEFDFSKEYSKAIIQEKYNKLGWCENIKDVSKWTKKYCEQSNIIITEKVKKVMHKSVRMLSFDTSNRK